MSQWPRYLKWRDGRPRWEPGPGLRRAGFNGRDLKDGLGQWLSKGAAVEAADALNAEVAEWRATGAKKSRRQKASNKHPRSIQALFDRYWKSADFTGLGERTREDYKNKAQIFLETPIDGATSFGDLPAAAMTKPAAFGFWEEIHAARGLAMANGIKAAVSPAFSYAELAGWRNAQSNPWFNLGRPTLPPRLAIWLPEQASVFLEIADELVDEQGRRFHSIGDAFVLGLHAGQRLDDTLQMPDSIFSAERIALTQMKTKALIDVKTTEQVAARVAGARERRRQMPIATIGGMLVINEVTGKPYNPNTFNKRFRQVRAAAAKKLPKVKRDPRWQGPKVFELAELRYQDTRDTYVTRSALAGNDAAHIAAVSGHSLTSITSIMKHYLALNRAMADAAQDRIADWLKKEGIPV